MGGTRNKAALQPASRSGVNVRLKLEHARVVDQLAAIKSMARSEVIAVALAAYLSSEGGGRCEDATARRFDTLTRQLEQVERGQTLLIETLALFIRDYLASTALLLEPHQEAARSRGRARFEQFVEQLARHLQCDGSFVMEPEQELAPGRSGIRVLGDEKPLAMTSPMASTGND